MSMTSLVQWFRENLLQPADFMQIGAIGATYLLARIFAAKVRQHIEKDIEKVEAHMRFVLSPAQFAIVLKYFFWLLLLWFCQVLFTRLEIPFDVLHLAVNFVSALLIVRFSSFYIKSMFWSRFVYVICLVVVSLRIFKLWDPTVQLLDSMTIGLGKISISVWGLTQAVIVFILLWALASAANRFIAHQLTIYSQPGPIRTERCSRELSKRQWRWW
jgi:small-conductance mechanosensitive channel